VSGRTTRATRTETCGKAEARTRLAHARAFADTAELVLDVDDDASLNVSASLAVLAGIAASDAACCARLGKRSRGQDHREAVRVLSGIADVGVEMGKDLGRLIDLKDGAHYGVIYVSETRARQAVRWAKRIVAAAEKAVLE
jgi:hypothetical protein